MIALFPGALIGVALAQDTQELAPTAETAPKSAEAPAAAPTSTETAPAPAPTAGGTAAETAAPTAAPAPAATSDSAASETAAAGAGAEALEPLAADAVVPAPPTKKLPLSTWGEVRLLGSLPPEAVLDTEGTTLGQGPVLDGRARLGLAYTAETWSVRTEWDLIEGQLAGDAWDIRGAEDARDRGAVGIMSADAFVPRRLSVDGRAGPVGIEAGLVTSHWGLGMLANDGAHDPVFGRSDFGDRVIRVRLGTRPVADVPLTVAIAGDRVVADEQATWSPFVGGQAAWQAIATVLWGEPDKARAGLYGVYRNQTEADGLRVTQVGVVDLYGDAPIVLPGWKLRVAGEAAGIFGSTTRGQSYNARDGLVVQSLGAVGLVEARPDALPASGMLRGGFASGDGNPDDGYSRDFTFDRDLDAGMVLFDELQGSIDAAAYAQLTDPTHSGGAPDGAELLVAEGSVRHATFIQPVVTVTPRPWLGLKAGALFAWNTSPITQPFATYRNGGVPVNHLGEPTSGYWLGTELDWAVTLGDVDATVLGLKSRPALLVQGGHLLASAEMGGGVVTLVTATGRLRW
ncbi:MAG: hypothetical protein Q8P41_22245 [Pseudomonadota bacterium]|nr:hypothetical protein [Pseudomonadota bacterium]